VNPDRERWNAKHARGGHELPSIPLLRLQGRLRPGTALDLAGGRGENAAILSLAGWRVVLADLSDAAVRLARDRAAGLRTPLLSVQADALRLPFRGPFDTIVVARFLERPLLPVLADLLRPGGTLYCEQPVRGLKPDYLARPGEFRALLPLLEPVVDEIDGDSAVFIGRRPVFAGS
jgi:SAM-dependent methyltransferase